MSLVRERLMEKESELDFWMELDLDWRLVLEMEPENRTEPKLVPD
jgi:hypothetical protein